MGLIRRNIAAGSGYLRGSMESKMAMCKLSLTHLTSASVNFDLHLLWRVILCCQIPEAVHFGLDLCII